jgi:hypothetical protein
MSIKSTLAKEIAMFLTGLIIGVIIGANIGFIVAGMFATSARQEKLMMQHQKAGKFT